MASIAGAVAGSLVSKAIGGGGGGGGGSSSQPKPFTPVNFYTPSGNVTWNGANGTATLSPDSALLKNNYLNQANNYNSSISSLYGPNRNNFYRTNASYTPKSYADYYKELAPQFTTTTAASSPGSKYRENYSPDYMPPYSGLFIGKGGGGTSIDTNGLNAAIQSATQRDQQANTTFDQAGYDAANAGYTSPEDRVYGLLRGLSAPQEQQDRTDLESRLYSQGMLGSANGQGYNPQQKALDDSQHQAMLQRELTSLTTTPQLLTQYQNLFNSAANGAQGIDQNLIDLLKTSSNVGIGAGSNSTQSALAQNQIAQSQGNFWQSAAGSIGKSVGDAATNLFSKYSPFSSNSTPISFDGGITV